MRNAAGLILNRLPPRELAHFAGSLISNVRSVELDIAKESLLVLSRLTHTDLSPQHTEKLLAALHGASDTVRRMAILAPAPLSQDNLRTLKPDEPLCEPPLAPLSTDPPATTTVDPEHGSFEWVFERLGGSGSTSSSYSSPLYPYEHAAP